MRRRTAFLAGAFMIPTIALAMLQNHSHMRDHPESSDHQWSELTASMGNMHSAMMSIQPSGDPNVDFVRMMLPHHQAAVDMAKTQLTYGTDPQMRRLAQEIITDQQSEIELMQIWLKQHEAHQTPVVHPTR